jgi:hypothetical protein
LREYMSESENLARVQQQQIAGSSQSSNIHSASEANRRTYNVANSLDSAAANFVGSNLNSRNSEFDAGQNLGNGGFTRVKQWEKQSKWASGELRKVHE